MTITVRRLLARTDLGLHLLSALPPTAAPAQHPLDRRITWVAGTDLEDPTPFLAEGNIVLTTGRQFEADAVETVGAYVTRLSRFGIRAIGFATGVISNVPAELVTACEREGMPLIDVPFRTPFIAITRYVADLVAAEAQSHTAWAADAQRTIALAAMRDDGLAASIAELGRRLERTVTLFDARGHELHAFPHGGHGAGVAADAERMLAREVRGASATESGVLLQTIGRGGDLRGVLAVDGPLDQAAQGVVSAVIALAGMALERERALADAALRVRTGVWQSLLAGHLDLAADLAGAHTLPRTFSVGMLHDDPRTRAELVSQRSLFVAQHGDLLIVVDPDTSWAARISTEHGVAIGLSTPATQSSAASAAREATAALRRADRTASVVSFDEVVDGGLRSLLDHDDARALARALLTPLVQHDDDGVRLLVSLRTWLRHNGQWDPAARALGIHRHTLKSHVEAASRVLARDLSDPETRAELLFALALADGS